MTGLVDKSADRLIISSLFLIIMLLCLPLVTATLTGDILISASGTIEYASARPLHVEGRYIKDDLGRVVFLRGVNKGGYNNYPTGRWQAEGESAIGGTLVFRESAVHYQMGALRDEWNISCMRWTITCKWWIENTNNYRYNVRRAIEIAAAYEIYIVFAPWRVGETGQDEMPFPPYTQSPEVIGSVQEFVDFWVSVANELGDLPNVIFDLFNEPAGGEVGRSDWQDAAQQCIDAIRDPTRGNSDALILYQYGYGTGPNKRLVDWYNEYPVDGTNIVISTHLYGPSGGYQYSQDYDTLKSQIETAQIKDVADVLNMPLLIGETGAEPSDLEFFTNALSILNEWELGYIGWIFYPLMPFALIQDAPYVPPPTDAGQILIDAMAGRV